MKNDKIINKTMDRQDLYSDGAQAVIQLLNELILELNEKNLNISSWYGHLRMNPKDQHFESINRGYGYKKLENASDDERFPWFLYWEIVWVYLNNDFREGMQVLDLGGSSSLFSYFLASRGCEVVTIDVKKSLVENADKVAAEMNWNLVNSVMDINDLEFDKTFDHITSICVFEHIPINERITVNRRIKELLKEGGFFSITFDYLNPSKLAQINSPGDVTDQFLRPSGLKLRGNREFQDNLKRYLLHPFYSPRVPGDYKDNAVMKGHFDECEKGNIHEKNDYTFGSLFLRK